MDNNKETELLELDEDHFFSSKVESYGFLVWKRFKRHKLAVIGIAVLIILAFAALFAPILAPYKPEEIHIQDTLGGMPASPSSKYLFGTDALGRDYLSRAMYGGRISLMVGIVAVGISIIIGVPLGCLAGYYGGIFDSFICRLIDFLYCIPTFFLILTANAMLPPSIFNVMVILGFFGWMGVARQVRAQFLSLRNQEFVQAAIALGFPDRVVVFKHLLPNALVPVIVSATIGVAGAIMTESGLSYLGLGVQEPAASWGSMLKTAQIYLTTAPWMAIIPGTLISITALALNFIGDALRDALDPRTTHH